MKKIIKSAFLLFSVITFAQETKTIQVYEYVNGVKDITPTQIIVKTQTETKVYQTTNGIKNLTPETIIKPNGYVYKVENGIQSLFPIQRLEVQTNSPLLPIPSLIGVGGSSLFD
jgi:hypothetical protein